MNPFNPAISVVRITHSRARIPVEISILGNNEFASLAGRTPTWERITHLLLRIKFFDFSKITPAEELTQSVNPDLIYASWHCKGTRLRAETYLVYFGKDCHLFKPP